MGVYSGGITTIPVAEFSNGIYVITVKTENGISNHKFIKE
jgi:hypothetical protein